MISKLSRGSILLLLLVTLFLFVAAMVRIFYGIKTNNSALRIEGYHALIDTVMSGVVLAVVIIVRSSMGGRFPYGLYRLEDLIAIIISFIIIFSLISEAPKVLSKPPTSSKLATEIQAFSIPLVAAAAIVKYDVGRRAGSPSLKADAAHMIVDMAISIGVLLGLALYSVTGSTLTYRVSVLIALGGLLLAAYEAGWESLVAILDLPKDKELYYRMLGAVRSIAEEAGVELSEFKVRWAGPAIFVECMLKAHPLDYVELVGRIVYRLKDKLSSISPDIASVNIAVLPSTRSSLKVAVPVDKGPNGKLVVSRHFARAWGFKLFSVHGNNIVSEELVDMDSMLGSENPGSLLRGAEIAERLYEMGVTDVATASIGEIAYAILLRHKILVWRAEDSTPTITVEKIVTGMAKLIDEPTREASWRARAE